MLDRKLPLDVFMFLYGVVVAGPPSSILQTLHTYHFEQLMYSRLKYFMQLFSNILKNTFIFDVIDKELFYSRYLI